MGERPKGGEGLRIVLNATAAVTGGGVTYWLNLLPALARIDAPHEYRVFVAAQQHRLANAVPSRFHVHRTSFLRPAVLSRLVWEQTRLPYLMRRLEADVMLAPNDIAPILAPRPVVMAIRNPNPYWGPPGSTLRERIRERILRILTRRSAHMAAHVFFVSEDSRRRISSVLGLAPEKTSVVYHGIGDVFRDPPGEGKRPAGNEGRAPYILGVSAVRVHKDWESLLRAFAGLRRSPGYRGHRLVIVGPVVEPVYYDVLRGLVKELALEEAVDFRGELAYAALPAVYRGADLFVLPSQAETFGHPLVEAMMSGVPVVSSDLEVSQEICGEAAVYFPAGDWRALQARMEEVLADESGRARRIAAGRARAERFSWDRTARETLSLLERAARARQRASTTS